MLEIKGGVVPGLSRTSLGIPEVCVSVKRDLFVWQKRPIEMISISEVCVRVKRGLPYGKRDLLHAQKRPTNTSIPEVCVRVKREVLFCS
jgi:hypothetical protein